MSGPSLPPYDHQPQPYDGPSFDRVMELRNAHLPPSYLTMYQQPIMLVEGSMQYVYDEHGKRYLDGFGGIATVGVGHCHPHVVAAATEQMKRLQHTTTIYLHPTIAEYAEKLTATLPDELDTVYFVNSGSEANDLAILMARLYSGNYDVIALRDAYHGGGASTMGLTAHSTWKYNTPHAFGIHHVRNADPYRGPWGYDDPDAGHKYAEEVRDQIDHGTPGRVAGYFAEAIQGVGGVTTYPDGYLAETYEIVRAAGGLCISDEVQSGFGRTGEHFWGFEGHSVVPDMVTMAKSIGNGTPLAAVATRREIAESLVGRIHFNTFGGNPVACAIGNAVLEVIAEDRLQENSADVGEYLIAEFKNLQASQSLIGDVRGKGFMIGVDLVTDRATRAPASEATAQILEQAKEMGLLLGKGGLRGNVIRIKPPMCLTRADADFIIEVLRIAMTEAST